MEYNSSVEKFRDDEYLNMSQDPRVLGADPKHFDLVFVANATAAIKLIADGFRDLGEKTQDKSFWYGYHREAHTSIILERWLEYPANSTVRNSKSTGLGLFAYPGQSNLSGRRLPKAWLRRIREHPQTRNTYTLFDAAALAMTSSLGSLFNDPNDAPDFTCLSLYKTFGFPDLGALVLRRASGHVLNLRRYFGGGTVAQLFPLNGDRRVAKKIPGLGGQYDMWNIHDGLEDGTLPFHSILALGLAIDTHLRLYGSMDVISRHCNYLARTLYKSLVALIYPNGAPVVEVYVDDPTMYGDPSRQGATFAFNVMRQDGTYVPWTDVERLPTTPVFISEQEALEYEEWEWNRMFSSGHACGANEMAIISRRPTGIVRASLGGMTTKANVHALLLFLHNEFIAEASEAQVPSLLESSRETLRLPL
ncbi:hypothetical protein QQZ08_009443 [Neonectria magnoliae]|uniref:Aminotransferase class V domain-containing protein n=1 Tax=Neonectria magnoliae TaxID=2732573 RepID=A0ABR1HNA0_9HYPO